MPAALNLVPSSIRNTPTGQRLAQTLESKNTALAKVRAENKDLAARPSRFKRAACVAGGAGATGLLLSMVDDPKIRVGVSAGLGIAGTVAGIAADSDAVFDAGVGAGAVATATGIEAAARAVRAKLQEAASQITGQKPTE